MFQPSRDAFDGITVEVTKMWAGVSPTLDTTSPRVSASHPRSASTTVVRGCGMAASRVRHKATRTAARWPSDNPTFRYSLSPSPSKRP